MKNNLQAAIIIIYSIIAFLIKFPFLLLFVIKNVNDSEPCVLVYREKVEET